MVRCDKCGGEHSSAQHDLERVKIIEQSDLPKEAKHAGEMAAIMGASDETVVRAAGSAINRKLSKEAAEAHPKHRKERGLDKVESELVDMMTEDTGAHFLDSGGAYGRMWQRNREVKDWKKRPAVRVELNDEGLDYFVIDLFHVLAANLKVTPRAKELRKKFDAYAKERPKESWFEIVEGFSDDVLKPMGYRVTSGNTYNEDTNLSQDYEFRIVRGKDEDVYDPTLMILMIHNGADIRGGYTAPKIFDVVGSQGEGLADLISDESDVWANDSKGNYSSRDDSEFEAASKHWKVKDGKLVDSTGKEVIFSTNVG